MKFIVSCIMISSVLAIAVLLIMISDGADVQELCVISNDHSPIIIHGYGDDVYCHIIFEKFLIYILYFSLIFFPFISSMLYLLRMARSKLRRYQLRKTRQTRPVRE